MTKFGKGGGHIPSGVDAPGDETEAGHPFLAFLNTVCDDGKTRHHDTFTTGGELLAQIRRRGFADGLEAPSYGQLRVLRTLREAGYGLLSAVAAGRLPRLEDRLQIESAIKSAMSDATLRTVQGRAQWHPGPLGGLHDHLALSLAGLLQSDDLQRLRECRRCTRLFLDHGRGTGRRWCTMARCGNRAKAQSFRDRKRSPA